ncbi:MAG TPA: LuxR C-terminal-related transcriptional regulator [Actinomycetota bacterium]|nr:LuxR C-terminal-related transcriptional regulator [Actinomycetota bacterium]
MDGDHHPQAGSDAEIARALGLRTTTVRSHVSSILARLRVADRTQAALPARAAGLGHD